MPTQVPVNAGTVAAGVAPAAPNPDDTCVKLARLQLVDRPWWEGDYYVDPETKFKYTKAQYALMVKKCKK